MIIAGLSAALLGSTMWWAAPTWALDGQRPGFILDAKGGRHMLGGAAASLDRILTVSNNSTVRTYVAADGSIQTAPANVPRIDYTSGVAELLLEGAVTNPIRNSIGSGAVVGSPGTIPTYWYISKGGGLAVDVVGTGVSSGVPYTRLRIYGTTTALAAFTLQFDSSNMLAAAAQGQTWTDSVFVRLVSGSFWTNYPNLIITETNSGGAFVTNGGVSLALTAGLKRFSHTRTLTGSTTAYVGPTFYAQWPTVGTVVDVTFDVALPQIEQASVPSSPVITNGAAVTRTADLCQLSTAAAAVLAGSGAVALRGAIPSGSVSQGQIVGQSSANGFIRTNTAGSGLVFDGRADDIGALVWLGALPGVFGLAVGWGASGRIGSLGGATALTDIGLADVARSPLYLGGPSGLVSGQAIRVRQLVGWTLPDRPSAAGIQAQAVAA